MDREYHGLAKLDPALQRWELRVLTPVPGTRAGTGGLTIQGVSPAGRTVPDMESVDYIDTFIAVAEDCPATEGTVPPTGRGGSSVAARTHELIAAAPYRLTSGDVIFTVYADRAAIPESERPAARREFYSRSQACLRSSPLGKRYGWGIHADGEGRLALVGRETPEYAEFVQGRRRSATGEPVHVVKAMRSSRARG